MYRSKSFDERLSQELKNPRFAQQYLLDLMEGDEGLTVEEALRHTIPRMGIKEFSEMADIPASHVVAFVKGRRNLKPDSLDTFLKPFRLRTRLVLEKAS